MYNLLYWLADGSRFGVKSRAALQKQFLSLDFQQHNAAYTITDLKEPMPRALYLYVICASIFSCRATCKKILEHDGILLEPVGRNMHQR